MTKKDYDIIASCIGAAYANTRIFADSGLINTAQSAIWDLKARLQLELSLQNPGFNTEKFNSRIQYWYEKHGGQK